MQQLIKQFLPESNILLKLLLPILILAILAALIAGWLKVKMKVRTPYTRKTFHFIIFSAAGLLQYYYGLQAVTIMGIIVFMIVLAAVWLGEKLWLYSALARETDYPHEKKFILLPLIATATGGVLSNILFPTTAYIGYFVGGWGDAVGEPVGTKWGKHRYTVPTLFGVHATRSIEGSLAVMLVSTTIAFLCLLNILHGIPVITILMGSVICGLVAAGVESISSHGLDNLTIQLCAAGVLQLFIQWQH